MSIPRILFIISIISSYATETTTSTNTKITTYTHPVNRTNIKNEIQTRHSDIDIKPRDTEIRPSDTEIKFIDTEIKSNNIKFNATKAKSIEPETATNDNGTRSKFQNKPGLAQQTWKIESGFGESNLTESSNKTIDVKEENDNTNKKLLKDFKPSQHLGSFFDEDSAEVIKTPVFGPVHKKPATGFISSPNDDYHSHETFNKIPKEIYYTHQEFPYKFEDMIFTRTKPGWTDSMESKPTVEVPVRVPAGGLYKSPEAFKEKPHSAEDFGLIYHEDGKEHPVEKRGNPWHNLLRLVTAFIPVGLIISALTPSVITIHNVDDKRQPSPLPYSRSDPGLAELPTISERCRRRLLCELRSDSNYLPSSGVPGRNVKHCYKIHCEDSDALWRTLRWLLAHGRGRGGAPHTGLGYT